jgi:sugar/nucleoside kinase (ribokinase family)
MNERSKGNRILFVGLNTVDIQLVVPDYPEPNTKTKASRCIIYPGGPATNAAVTCAHVGEKVDLFTPVGKHAFTDFILEDIRKFGIHIIDPVSYDYSDPVFASIVSSENNGDCTVFLYHPQIQYNIYDDINFELNINKLVMFDGYYPEFALPLVKRCKERNICTVLDGGSWKSCLAELLYYVDVALCSNDFQPPGVKENGEIIKYMQNKGVKLCAITRGNESILYAEGKVKSEIDTSPVDSVDTLGAGDVFHGAFCYYYSNGFNFTESLKKASYIAGESCKSLGTRQWTDNFMIDNASV